MQLAKSHREKTEVACTCEDDEEGNIGLVRRYQLVSIEDRIPDGKVHSCKRSMQPGVGIAELQGGKEKSKTCQTVPDDWISRTRSQTFISDIRPWPS